MSLSWQDPPAVTDTTPAVAWKQTAQASQLTSYFIYASADGTYAATVATTKGDKDKGEKKTVRT